MISLSDLPHRLYLIRVRSSGTRDAYSGKLAEQEEPLEVPCFFSGVQRSIRHTDSGKVLVEEATVFLLPDADVGEADRFDRVEDGDGVVLCTGSMTITKVRRQPDESGVSHIEVTLSQDASS